MFCNFTIQVQNCICYSAPEMKLEQCLQYTQMIFSIQNSSLLSSASELTDFTKTFFVFSEGLNEYISGVELKFVKFHHYRPPYYKPSRVEGHQLYTYTYMPTIPLFAIITMMMPNDDNLENKQSFIFIVLKSVFVSAYIASYTVISNTFTQMPTYMCLPPFSDTFPSQLYKWTTLALYDPPPPLWEGKARVNRV